MKKKSSLKIEATVALCKCPSSRQVFGMRIEKRGADWVRTWAFKISEDKATREGFDQTRITSSMQTTPEYAGCPYCGTMGLAQCSCGKLFCWDGVATSAVCPWCGEHCALAATESVEFKGGGL